MSAHTPTPWELFEKNGVIAIRNPRARSSNSEIVFWSGFEASHYPKQASANAALIVRAVNRDHHFDALISHLRRLAIRGCDEEALALLEIVDPLAGASVGGSR